MGGSLIKDYMISFSLDGTLSIYETNKELVGLEVVNFKIIFF